MRWDEMRWDEMRWDVSRLPTHFSGWVPHKNVRGFCFEMFRLLKVQIWNSIISYQFRSCPATLWQRFVPCQVADTGNQRVTGLAPPASRLQTGRLRVLFSNWGAPKLALDPRQACSCWWLLESGFKHWKQQSPRCQRLDLDGEVLAFGGSGYEKFSSSTSSAFDQKRCVLDTRGFKDVLVHFGEKVEQVDKDPRIGW